MAKMTQLSILNFNGPLVIAALHLPPLMGSNHPAAQPMDVVRTMALRNVERAVKADVPAVMIQDLVDFPWAPEPQPFTVATLSVIGENIRREFPNLILGVCLMSHAPKESLSIAQAIGAQFVRLKVYVGAMVKAEGLVEGCAYAAIQYRSLINANDIAILADVYDRTGQPLGRMPLVDEARQAAVFGRADGLVLTGSTIDESMQMLADVQQANFRTLIFLGGGATSDNISKVLEIANGVIVSSAFKPINGWTKEAMLSEWELLRIQEFMDAVNKS